MSTFLSCLLNATALRHTCDTKCPLFFLSGAVYASLCSLHVWSLYLSTWFGVIGWHGSLLRLVSLFIYLQSPPPERSLLEDRALSILPSGCIPIIQNWHQHRIWALALFFKFTGLLLLFYFWLIASILYFFNNLKIHSCSSFSDCSFKSMYWEAYFLKKNPMSGWSFWQKLHLQPMFPVSPWLQKCFTFSSAGFSVSTGSRPAFMSHSYWVSGTSLAFQPHLMQTCNFYLLQVTFPTICQGGWQSFLVFPWVNGGVLSVFSMDHAALQGSPLSGMLPFLFSCLSWARPPLPFPTWADSSWPRRPASDSVDVTSHSLLWLRDPTWFPHLPSLSFLRLTLTRPWPDLLVFFYAECSCPWSGRAFSPLHLWLRLILPPGLSTWLLDGLLGLGTDCRFGHMWFWLTLLV